MMERRKILAGLTALPGLAVARGVQAQASFPDRPLRLIVAYAPGGGTDLVARTVAQRMSLTLKQTVVVDNRPGAGGNTATEQAAAARPDGYTLLVGNQGPMSVNPTLFRNLRVDPAAALEPVALLADAPLVLVVGPKSRATNMVELLDEIRNSKGRLDYGSAGNGSASHLATALLLQTTGLEATHIPYRGAGPALTDVVAGTLSFITTTLPSVVGLMSSNAVRAIAVTGKQRMSLMPEIPTVAETVPDYDATAWYGIMVPKGTPDAVKARLTQAIEESLTAPDVVQRLREEGAEPSKLTQSEFGGYIASERERWAKVIHAGAISVD